MSSDRDDYAACLAELDRKLEQNHKSMEKMKNFMTADITNSIKHVIRNSIKDNLVEESTNKTLTEITDSERMDALVDNTVTRKTMLQR